jgi:hypothetical protein
LKRGEIEKLSHKHKYSNEINVEKKYVILNPNTPMKSPF